MADEKRIIEIVVKATGDADLKRLSREMQGMRKDTLAARKEMEQSNKTLAGMRKEAAATRRELAQTNQTLGGFGSTFGKLTKAFGAGFALTQLVRSSDVVQDLTKHVQELAGEFIDATLKASGFTDLLDDDFWLMAKQGARDLSDAIGDIFAKMEDAGEDSKIAKAFKYLNPFGGVVLAKEGLENYYAEGSKFDAPTLDTAGLLNDLTRDTAKLMEQQAKEANDLAMIMLKNRREFEEQQRLYRESISPRGLRTAGADSYRHPVTGPGPDAQAFAQEMDTAARAVGEIEIDLGGMGAYLETMKIEAYGWTDALDDARAIMREVQSIQADMVNQALAWGDTLTFAFKGVLTGELHNTRDLLRSITTDMRNFYAELASRAAAEQTLEWIRKAIGVIGAGVVGAGQTYVDAPSINPSIRLSAKGNAFAGGHVLAMANGAIVTGPTLFPMARGMGLMGEAGPEAVMPLRRGKDGRLGVSSSTPRVIINNQTGVTAEASVQAADDRLEITLRAATLGANMAVAEMNRSIRSGYGSTAQSLARSYGLRRRV